MLARLGLGLVCLVCAVLLGLVVRRHVPSFDAAAVRGLHRDLLGRRVLVDALKGITTCGAAWFLGLLVVVVAVRPELRGAAVVLLVALAAAVVVGHVAKELFDRARPVVASPFSLGSGPGYPSGHTLQATAVYGSAAVLVRRWLLPAAAIVAVAFSRVALGVHYPTDVVGGVLFGLAIVSAVWIAVDAFDARRRRGLPTPPPPR